MYKYTTTVALYALSVLMLATGCSQRKMSVMHEDPAAGLNGGFEQTKEGLPVNWNLYTAETVPDASFELGTDSQEFKEGKQSLKFTVHACNAKGGWLSPGLSRELPANPGETYTVSFWVKNAGSAFKAQIGAVSIHEGASEAIVRAVETSGDWQRFEHSYTVPAEMNALRFELNVLQPGQFWLDDVVIRKR